MSELLRIGVATAMRDWWDVQWTITLGCSRVSEGCRNCSAEIMTARSPNMQDYATLRDGPHDARWTGKVVTFPDMLKHPARWREPWWVFVSSTSDLFHEDVPNAFIAQALRVMEKSPRHTFGILTKRAQRMREFFRRRKAPDNVMLGVSVEDDSVMERIEHLTGIDAAIRWVSAEPLLGPLVLPADLLKSLDWLCAGPEIGENARPCKPEWMQALVTQCRGAGIPFFSQHPIEGEEIREWPAL